MSSSDEKDDEVRKARNAQPVRPWPDNTAEIYRELAAEDRELAELMMITVRETWPRE